MDYGLILKVGFKIKLNITFKGQITKPEDVKTMFYLPQKPYLFNGTIPQTCF